MTTGYDREHAVPVIRWRWVAIGIIAGMLATVAAVAWAEEVYTLAFSACQDADHCKRYELLVESCLGYGMPFLAAWEGAHPGWSVTHWTCAQGQPS